MLSRSTCTEHRDQVSICPFPLCKVSVLAELVLGRLRYSLTDVPAQSSSVLGSGHARDCLPGDDAGTTAKPPRLPQRATGHVFDSHAATASGNP